ncbi:Annexin_1 [Hexamita inflata]|uniref:Annexin 1 n=1 Tax=Hexamita inflata TaxID=28002 RepID=A0AA86QYY9_9EUKA|nr:Annexin 1 [Hexamita inflata]
MEDDDLMKRLESTFADSKQIIENLTDVVIPKEPTISHEILNDSISKLNQSDNNPLGNSGNIDSSSNTLFDKMVSAQSGYSLTASMRSKIEFNINSVQDLKPEVECQEADDAPKIDILESIIKPEESNIQLLQQQLSNVSNQVQRQFSIQAPDPNLTQEQKIDYIANQISKGNEKNIIDIFTLYQHEDFSKIATIFNYKFKSLQDWLGKRFEQRRMTDLLNAICQDKLAFKATQIASILLNPKVKPDIFDLSHLVILNSQEEMDELNTALQNQMRFKKYEESKKYSVWHQFTDNSFTSKFIRAWAHQFRFEIDCEKMAARLFQAKNNQTVLEQTVIELFCTVNQLQFVQFQTVFQQLYGQSLKEFLLIHVKNYTVMLAYEYLTQREGGIAYALNKATKLNNNSLQIITVLFRQHWLGVKTVYSEMFGTMGKDIRGASDSYYQKALLTFWGEL